MRGEAALSPVSEGAAYAPETARLRSVNVGMSECPEAQCDEEKRTERKINNKKQENEKRVVECVSGEQTQELGRSANLARKAVTAAGWLADRCFKAVSNAGLGLAVGAGVSAAVLDGLTGLVRASAGVSMQARGEAVETVAGANVEEANVDVRTKLAWTRSGGMGQPPSQLGLRRSNGEQVTGAGTAGEFAARAGLSSGVAARSSSAAAAAAALGAAGEPAPGASQDEVNDGERTKGASFRRGGSTGKTG